MYAPHSPKIMYRAFKIKLIISNELNMICFKISIKAFSNDSESFLDQPDAEVKENKVH